MANIIYYIAPLHFGLLVIISYWITNILGLFLMWLGGKKFILSFRQRIRAALLLVIMLIIITVVMAHFDKSGKLLPLNEYFAKCRRIE